MVSEQEPASRHEDRIGEHRQALELMIELSEVFLGSTSLTKGASLGHEVAGYRIRVSCHPGQRCFAGHHPDVDDARAV
jgi:hypothetical protein